ncbi:putative ankyrin repeat-containing protein [Hypoxylon crocopeplum]|nr:putative ankyrin repeat-containing protein [Hypoxylon crocopeplum]
MRLLDTGTADLQIQYFKDDSIPQYAILSHTWDEAELTFQEKNGVAAPEKQGYRKVERCCSMARDCGHDYVWIDSCCIDKTSSEELSEAINSMYYWYQEATVCYAYLADVPHDPSRQLPILPDSEFSRSKWFRRGWTLQELIAPSEVIFLDREWKEIGTRSTLRDIISSITRIPVDILMGHHDFESLSVAQRMSWAAERETTKIEDRAYSLIGIFGINMPLIYGEGQKAFIRLQEEIMKILDDQTIFAWKSKKENHGGLLATSPDAFKESAGIVPFNHYISSNIPLTISNKGIHLGLRFMGIGRRGLGLGVIHCVEIGKEDRLIAIYLRDLSLTMDRFERVRCQDFERLSLSTFRQSLYPIRGIYARQQHLLRSKTPREKLRPNSDSRRADGIQTNSIDEDGRTRLSHAAERGGYDEVKWLLAGSDIQVADSKDEDGRTPLSYAAGRGHVEILWLLLQTGRVDVNSVDKNGLTPLLHAIVEGHEEVAWLLLTRSDVQAQHKDRDGRTLLSHASRGGHEAMLLCNEGADIHSRDFSGRTPLSHAAETGNEIITGLLLSMDVYVESRDDHERTPLSYAAANGNRTIVRQLLDHDANIETRDLQDRTPLRHAVENRCLSMMDSLIDWGADIESTDINGWTPLMYAIQKSDMAMTQLLLDRCANVNAKDSRGSTPTAQAKSIGNYPIIRLLKQYEEYAP